MIDIFVTGGGAGFTPAVRSGVELVGINPAPTGQRMRERALAPLDWHWRDSLSRRQVKLLPVILASVLVGLAGGCRTAESPVVPKTSPLVARIYLEALPREQGLAVTLPISGAQLMIDSRAVLLESDVLAAELVPAEFGTALQLTFTPAAARDLYRKTVGAQGRRLVLMLNSAAVAAQRIGDPVTGGTLQFYPEVAAEQLPSLLADLRGTTATVQAKLAPKK